MQLEDAFLARERASWEQGRTVFDQWDLVKHHFTQFGGILPGTVAYGEALSNKAEHLGEYFQKAQLCSDAMLTLIGMEVIARAPPEKNKKKKKRKSRRKSVRTWTAKEFAPLVNSYAAGFHLCKFK